MDSQVPDINLVEASNTFDPCRRDAELSAVDESLKATRRFLNASIMACEAHATRCVESGAMAVHNETWAFYRGKAEGLRLALRALADA